MIAVQDVRFIYEVSQKISFHNCNKMHSAQMFLAGADFVNY